jgi:capsular polysaccharide biosynthesis protein
MRIEAPFVECGNPSPYKLNLLREKVVTKVTFEKTHGILIHRQKNRRILNESEVFNRMKELYPSLTWVIFDTLSVEDTATLFSKAAVIVAPHGAGLTNMIFSPKGTEIIECMPIEQPNACYWHMSEMMKNPYKMVPCHTENYECDMRVDVTKL